MRSSKSSGGGVRVGRRAMPALLLCEVNGLTLAPRGPRTGHPAGVSGYTVGRGRASVVVGKESVVLGRAPVAFGRAPVPRTARAASLAPARSAVAGTAPPSQQPGQPAANASPAPVVSTGPATGSATPYSGAETASHHTAPPAPSLTTTSAKRAVSALAMVPGSAGCPTGSPGSAPASSVASAAFANIRSIPVHHARNRSAPTAASGALEDASTDDDIPDERARRSAARPASREYGLSSVYPDTCRCAPARNSPVGSWSGCSPLFAPASGSMLRSPSGPTSTTQVPVQRSGSGRTWTSTPAALSAAAASRPGPSAPTRPTNATACPATASQTAVLAPDPPWWLVIRAGVSDPAASGPSSLATTSVITSPTTITSGRSVAGGGAVIGIASRVRPRSGRPVPRCSAPVVRSRPGWRRGSARGSSRAGTGSRPCRAPRPRRPRPARRPALDRATAGPAGRTRPAGWPPPGRDAGRAGHASR